MGARQKLNQGYFVGALATAGLIGGLAQSFAVFGIAAALLVVASLLGGDLRPPPSRRQHDH